MNSPKVDEVYDAKKCEAHPKERIGCFTLKPIHLIMFGSGTYEEWLKCGCLELVPYSELLLGRPIR
jgi:hypothetical protein